MEFNRRKTLKIGLTGFGGILFTLMVAPHFFEERGYVGLPDALNRSEVAAHLGRLRLKQFKNPVDEGSLISTLFGPNAAALSHQERLDVLHEKISREFAEEEVVELDGWVYSLTEANLFALVAKLQGAS